MLGHGAFAICLSCRKRATNESLAVKVVLRSDVSSTYEADMLKQCQGHPGIVRLHAVLHDSQFTYIVTERLNGGSLLERLTGSPAWGALPAAELMAIVDQLLAGVAHIHDCGIAHRDLKPENVVFVGRNSNELRICDFGFAKRAADEAGMSAMQYTLDYASPEVMYGKPVTQACDLWALGVIMYRLMCGSRPFGDGHTASVMRNIKRGRFNRQQGGWRALSTRMQQVIGGLLSLEVKTRRAAQTSLIGVLRGEQVEAEAEEEVAVELDVNLEVEEVEEVVFSFADDDYGDQRK